MIKTVLDTNELNIWDRRKLNNIIGKMWDNVSMNERMLKRNNKHGLISELIIEELDYYSRAVYI